jgi:hypothetical protein
VKFVSGSAISFLHAAHAALQRGSSAPRWRGRQLALDTQISHGSESATALDGYRVGWWLASTIISSRTDCLDRAAPLDAQRRLAYSGDLKTAGSSSACSR